MGSFLPAAGEPEAIRSGPTRRAGAEPGVQGCQTGCQSPAGGKCPAEATANLPDLGPAAVTSTTAKVLVERHSTPLYCGCQVTNPIYCIPLVDWKDTGPWGGEPRWERVLAGGAGGEQISSFSDLLIGSFSTGGRWSFVVGRWPSVFGCRSSALGLRPGAPRSTALPQGGIAVARRRIFPAGLPGTWRKAPACRAILNRPFGAELSEY